MTRKQRHIAWRPMLPAVGERRRNRLYGIYSRRQMDNLIMYEKTRSDRRGTSLSLVLFDTSILRRRGARKFVEEVLTVVRTTDHVGWFGKSSLAVLLPETDRGGAEVFLRHATELSRPSWIGAELYTYPEMWLESQDHDNGNGSGHAGSNGNGHRPNGNHRADEKVRDFTRVNFARETPRWKRVLDITGAGLGLIALAPLFAFVSVWIKVVSPGPVIFRQKRVGMGRKEFTFFKFRTMHVNNDESYHAQHARSFISGDRTMDKLDEEDPRIIFGGRVLRKTAIDEFPQLINILRGEMSLVGPRPCIPYEAEEYHRWHTGRFSILPGLTGLWQVSGKNKLTFQQMIRLDIAYEKRRSLWLDLWIILATLPAIGAMVLESVGKRVEQYRHCEEDEAQPQSLVQLDTQMGCIDQDPQTRRPARRPETARAVVRMAERVGS